ncbi:FAD-binding protein [Saccharopolyspora erythraea]|uniref:FAD-binding protein n=1 Tax=Saccharopolyspora erythraea TaxID=1836 RepID=UPI0020132BBB|nr:FAD-binding protein [Saccharopolyspora erythraea]
MLLEKGSREDVGGNAAFSGGLFLFRYDGPDDLTSITQDFEPGMRAERIEAPAYTGAAYAAELMAMSDDRADPRLVEALAERSLDTMRWLASNGVRFTFNRSVGAHVRDGALRIPPGQILTSTGEGMSRGFEVIKPLLRHAERIGVEIRWSTPLTDVVRDNARVTGVVSGHSTVPADAVAIASGGFQASRELRHRHLGPEWENAKLRGKSHWATPLERPPFVAYHTVAGLTFTFCGVRIDPDGRALGADGMPVPALYAAGEATGGLFYGDYPGGAALMRAAVFGRAAGHTAATETTPHPG